MSILRKWGACEACGAWSFELLERHGLIEGSGRHAEGVADHPVRVVATPLKRSLNEYLDRARQ
jgi:hypothetical protein